jgi:hypothetical protein
MEKDNNYLVKQIYSWKWSLGESYYKSARPEKKQINISTQNNFDLENFEKQYNAINQSLEENYLNNQFDNDNELIGITNSVFSRNQLNNQITIVTDNNNNSLNTQEIKIELLIVYDIIVIVVNSFADNDLK